MNNESVKDAINKAKEFANSEKGQETIETIKVKVEDFVEDKTNGKGIFGFGKRNNHFLRHLAITPTKTKPADDIVCRFCFVGLSLS